MLMDFSGFYDNIRHDLLLKAIKKHIKDPRLVALLEQIVTGFRQDVSYLSDEEVQALWDGKYKALDYKDVPRKEMGLFLNLRKTRIVKIGRTFRYMQNKYFLTETGRVVERPNPKRITGMRRKMKRLKKAVQAGRITLADVERMFQSWRGNYYKTLSKAQRRNMDAVYNDLIGGLQA